MSSITYAELQSRANDILTHRFTPKIIFGASVLLFILVVGQFFVQPTSSDNSALNPLTDTKPLPTAHDIANLHLFGVAPSNNYQGITNTRLPLILEGVMLTQPSSQQSALIADSGEPAKLYRIGDTIAGKAQLVEILSDRVILDRKDNLERLMLRPAEQSM